MISLNIPMILSIHILNVGFNKKQAKFILVAKIAKVMMTPHLLQVFLVILLVQILVLKLV